MPERKITWLGSAGYWVLGCLATIAVLGLVTALGRLALGTPAPSAPTTRIIQDVHGFHSTLDVVVIVGLAVQVGLAFILTVPLQATALLLRRRAADGWAYARIVVLTLASSLVTFAILYPALLLVKAGLEVDAQALLLAAALTLLYLVHLIILGVGGRFARTTVARG